MFYIAYNTYRHHCLNPYALYHIRTHTGIITSAHMLYITHNFKDTYRHHCLRPLAVPSLQPASSAPHRYRFVPGHRRRTARRPRHFHHCFPPAPDPLTAGPPVSPLAPVVFTLVRTAGLKVHLEH